MSLSRLSDIPLNIQCTVRLRHRLLSASVLISAVLTSGCSSMGGVLAYEDVKPWERGALADDGMQPVLDTMDQSVDEHIYFSREASTGGGGVRGGGCGCN